MKAIEEKKDLLKYIPQRDPFVLVDKLFKTGEKNAITGFLVRENHIMVANGKFSEAGIIENIAQSAAIYMGNQFLKKGTEVPLGYIASIKNLEIYGLPNIGDELITEIIITNTIMNINVISGKVTVLGKKIATCELKVFIQKELKNVG